MGRALEEQSKEHLLWSWQSPETRATSSSRVCGRVEALPARVKGAQSKQ